MDIRDYEYIVSIAEHQSISRAAASLFITQSALTKYLQRTEQLIGMPLFLRRGHLLQLTEAGRLYVETGKQIRSLDQNLMQQLEQMRARQQKQIRLGFGIGRCNEIFDQVLPDFYRCYPDINVLTRIATSGDLLRQVEQGALDLALVVSAENLAGLTYLPVTPSYLTAVVPENSPLIDRAAESPEAPYPAIPIAALAEVPLVITPPATRSGMLARQILEQYGIAARIKLEVGDTRTLLDAVEGGLGTGILLSVPLGNRRLRCLSLAETVGIRETVSIVWKSDKVIPPAMQDMIDRLREIR